MDSSDAGDDDDEDSGDSVESCRSAGDVRPAIVPAGEALGGDSPGGAGICEKPPPSILASCPGSTPNDAPMSSPLP